MKRLKILQLCSIDVSVDALLKPLILKSMDEGHEVHNACTDTGRFKQLEQEGLTMININIARKIDPIKNIKSVLSLYKLMKKEKYDVVHVHTPVAALLGRIAAKLARVPHIIYTAHGFYFHEEMSPKQYKFYYLIEKYAARFLTDWLLLQSKEDYELSVEEKFLPENKIIHLSNGVDVRTRFNLELYNSDFLDKKRNKLGLSENDFVFSFIGRLVKEKGIFELLEAFFRIYLENHNVKLLLIGGILESERDQQSYQKLEKLLNNENILQLGFRDDIPELLGISDVFVLPSYREGLPRSIIEAMAMEKPIIASNIRGCREEVFEDVNGILVEKESTESLYDAMNRLYNDKSLVQKMGKESRKIATELFNEEKVLEKQIKLFERLSS